MGENGNNSYERWEKADGVKCSFNRLPVELLRPDGMRGSIFRYSTHSYTIDRRPGTCPTRPDVSTQPLGLGLRVLCGGVRVFHRS